MEDIDVVQRFQPLDDLNENPPDFILLEVALFLLMLGNFLEQVTVVCVFHYNADKGDSQELKHVLAVTKK